MYNLISIYYGQGLFSLRIMTFQERVLLYLFFYKLFAAPQNNLFYNCFEKYYTY